MLKYTKKEVSMAIYVYIIFSFQDLKSNLRRMFSCDKKSIIFMETSLNFKHFPHAVIECIPISEEDGDMAPFYFKVIIVYVLLK